MKKSLLASIIGCSILIAGCGSDDKAVSVPEPEVNYISAIEHLRFIGDTARYALDETERLAAVRIQERLEDLGFTVEVQEFTFVKKVSGVEKTYPSQNLVIEVKGTGDKVFVLGAHYDSTGIAVGSTGVGDNASGVAVLMELAQKWLHAKNKPTETLRFVFFGAEEHGKKGSQAYVASNDVSNVSGMINLDTLLGGDQLYIHSAHENVKEYSCANPETYSFDPVLRDKLLTIAGTEFLKQPGYEGYPEGQTGGWSDHQPFACAGIPVAYIEATNFAIDGQYGNDGYSQTTDANAWDCFDEENMTACDRKTEKKWGKVWHTERDTFAYLDSMADAPYPKLSMTVNLLHSFLTARK